MIVDRWIIVESSELDRNKRDKIKTRLTFFPDPAEPEFTSCYREQSNGSLIIPRGAWAFPELEELRYKDRRVKPEMPELEFKGTLDYEGNGKKFVSQRKAVISMVENEQGTIVRSPGTGKSIIALNFIARSKTRALVIVNTDDIIDQWEDYANEFVPDLDVGRIKADRFEVAHLTLATIQTINRRLEEGVLTKEFWKQFGTVMVDECFVAGTLVEGTPIEEIRPGHMLSTGQVKRVIKKTPSSLVRVKAGNHEWVCTPSHLFMTYTHGWVEARYLKNEMLLVQGRDNSHSFKGREGSLLSSKKDLLLRRMLSGIYEGGSEQDYGSHKSEVCVGSNEKKESYASGRDTREAISDASGYRTQTASSGWEWSSYSGGAATFGYVVGVAHGSSSKNECPELPMVSTSPLQAGYSKCGFENSRRGRWSIAQHPCSSSSGSAEGEAAEFVRVESIEILEPGSDGRFGGLCPDGFVYDLEVEGSHTYLANGALVHNCHHAPATTYEKLINHCPAYYRFGFSASETRSDGLEPIIGYLFGPKIHYYKPKASMPVKVDKVLTPFSYSFNGGNQYTARRSWHSMIEKLVADEKRNKLIAEHTDKLISEGRSTLLLSTRIEHLGNIYDLLEHKEDSVILTGRMSRQFRRDTLQKFREGKVKCVLATQLANEALDIPILSALVLSFPAKHKDGIFQKVGRALREHPGKKSVKIVDIVDHRVPVLRRQWYERRDFYKGEGYKINTISAGIAEAVKNQLSFFAPGRRTPVIGARRD